MRNRRGAGCLPACDATDASDGEVVLRTNHPDLRRREHARDEGVLASRTLGELRNAVHGRGHTPPQRPRHPVECAKDVAIRERVAHDLQVDVTPRSFLGLSDRTVNEGDTNARRNWLQRLTQRFREANRFEDEAPELREERRGGVGLKVL